MKKIETEFTTHEEAEEWAEAEGYTIVMSGLNNGRVTLHVI